MIGQWKCGSNTSPYASNSTAEPMRKPHITIQCHGATERNFAILVCATNSTIIVFRRGTNGPKRVPSGWPSRMILICFSTAATNTPQATTLTATATSPRTSWRVMAGF